MKQYLNISITDLYRLVNKNPRGWLTEYCEKEGYEYSNIKQKLYRYRQKLKSNKMVVDQHRSTPGRDESTRPPKVNGRRENTFFYSDYEQTKKDLDKLLQKQKRLMKQAKSKIISMNDVHKWMLEHPNDIITLKMFKPKMHGRNDWKDQFSKFSNFLSIINQL